jgi:carboxypeptidase Taq
MAQTKDPFTALQKISQNIATLNAIHSVLSWDQETYMPQEGIESRSMQLEILSSIVHKHKTSPTFKKALSKLIDIETGAVKADLPPPIQAAAKEWRREFLKDTKIPNSFVKKFTKTTSSALHAWSVAKKKSSYKDFLPHLEKIVTLCKKKADILGFKDHPYDALLDLYEPEMTTSVLTELFGKLKSPLTELLKSIQAVPQNDDRFLFQQYPFDQQMRFSHQLLASLGFSKEKSRLDISSHPFCMGIHPKDTRLTTRVYENHLTSNLFSVIHEAGHGLYNMNLPLEYYGTPLCEQISLGIDESQSRFWETIIGRSLPFWQHFYPALQKEFPEQLSQVSLQDFYRGINVVKPSLIRVEADEVTYCLHVIVRFEIEKALIEGSLQLKELPEAWNQKMKEMIGITPSNDAEGCLQDIHWSMGAIGYFPTYALGNLCAAQLFQTFVASHPDWQAKVMSGDLSFIIEWLKNNIHKFGKAYTSQELIQKITGKPLSFEPYIHYLKAKYQKLYPIT